MDFCPECGKKMNGSNCSCGFVASNFNYSVPQRQQNKPIPSPSKIPWIKTLKIFVWILFGLSILSGIICGSLIIADEILISGEKVRVGVSMIVVTPILGLLVTGFIMVFINQARDVAEIKDLFKNKKDSNK